ncbi:MAG TPA: YcfL family protein [Verrucomicrobiae bacterium]
MKTKIAMFLLAAVAFAGCESSPSVNTVQNAQPVGQRNVIQDRRIITDKSFSHRVGVLAVNTVLTPGDLLKVQVELLNRTGSIQRFSYSFEWFDLNGMQVANTLSAVVPDQINPGESKFISGLAPSPVCRDFHLKLLRAKDQDQ